MFRQEMSLARRGKNWRISPLMIILSKKEKVPLILS